MNGFNKTKNSCILGTAASLFVLAIIAVSAATIIAPTAATTNTTTSGNATIGTVTSTTSSSSGIELSPQPLWQERSTTLSLVPLNQTHMEATYIGNGTLSPPGSTETINYSANGSALISLPSQSAQAKETITTEDGDTAVATLYEIQKSNSATGESRGIVIAVINTNSTGGLAPLNGTIAAGIDNMTPNGESDVTFWRWESGANGSRMLDPTPQ